MAGMEIKRVLISDPVDSAAVDLLKSKGIDVDLKTSLSKDELLAAIKDYDALVVRSVTQVTADVIQAGTAASGRLKLIGRAGVGVDNIDTATATNCGVVVINAPGGNTISAAELTCGLIMDLSRNISAASGALKAGSWDRKKYTGSELQGKTLGIIGLGRIGREVAARMQSFGMTTIGYDPITPVEVARAAGIEPLPLDQIWPQADYLTFHTPLIRATKYMLNNTTFAACKRGVRVVNAARGGIICESALLSALESGQCSAAGLDVYEQEPPTCTGLLAHPRVVCLPHLGASTREAQQRVAIEIAEQFLDLAAGRPVPGVVNAPLLGQLFQPNGRSYARLGEALGQISARLSPTATEFKIFITQPDLDLIAGLITSSVLVGLLKGRQSGSGPGSVGGSINLLNAPALGKSAGLELTSGVYPGVPPNSVTVYTMNASVVGLIRGGVAYLHNINRNYFQPPLQLVGRIAFLDTDQSVGGLLADLATAKKADIRSVSIAKDLHAVTFGDPLPGPTPGATVEGGDVPELQLPNVKRVVTVNLI